LAVERLLAEGHFIGASSRASFFFFCCRGRWEQCSCCGGQSLLPVAYVFDGITTLIVYVMQGPHNANHMASHRYSLLTDYGWPGFA
jgi:hypothetical protein